MLKSPTHRSGNAGWLGFGVLGNLLELLLQLGGLAELAFDGGVLVVQ